MEIEKRREILEKLGHKVSLVAGFDPRVMRDKHIITISQIDLKSEISRILRKSFYYQKSIDKDTVWQIYQSEEQKIYQQFLAVLDQKKPDLIFIHNILSLGYNLPATTAIIKTLDSRQVPLVCVHHDFWWERNLFRRVNYRFVGDVLKNLPPKKNYILKHQVINNFAKKELFQRRKIMSEKMSDIFDFSKKFPKVDSYNFDFLKKFKIKGEDIVVLHATRIVERKVIENAILFAAELEKEIKAKVWLLLPNFIEVESQTYFNKLKAFAHELKVNFLWIGDLVLAERQRINGRKIYSFWDCYQFADIVTFTSSSEGFGNQLLEAFWAKKIPIVFEYPVFKNEIKSEGYSYISLGEKMRTQNGLRFVDTSIIKKAAKKAKIYLQNQNLYQKTAKKNYQIAKKNHDIKYLEQNLTKIINSIK